MSRQSKPNISTGDDLHLKRVKFNIQPEAGMLVAKETIVFRYEGADHVFHKDVERVRAGHPILKGREHLFKPITAHYEIEQATNAPGERRGA